MCARHGLTSLKRIRCAHGLCVRVWRPLDRGSDCIPPHIDSHDFSRPFVTLSLLSEQPILLGLQIQVMSDGEFAAPFALPLPVGSVLVLSGNGADVAKHCIPAVSAPRISLTFRRVADSKQDAVRRGEALPTSPADALPRVRDRERRYSVPIVGFKEPWLEKVERGEKTRDGRPARDRVCKNLRFGDHFVGVSGARHLLLRVTANATYFASFGGAWETFGDALVPRSIAAVRGADEAQRFWETTFNEGMRAPPRTASILVLGVECIRRLEWGT